MSATYVDVVGPLAKTVRDAAIVLDVLAGPTPEIPSNIVNDIGLPVVTLPFAYYDDGTPFVLAFIGDLWTEAKLLAYAYDLEQATLVRIPPILRKKTGQ